ncbi:alkaline phosphatase D family protein [Paeniglutamicibacter psychrophenolicus]|uniref:alkaline phosphatase D family protein n=1 Tax=Paeniglutamicibacter psychrophenolicus TaxID=257454 RepID=UPI00277D2A42|nr:alkaline phosphatase D family protein [Paeniglutamicibacter psychrophenolicus]MDQ0095600.1 alkaline phosphatase D [Paeniglutamicibacter psychrophenolicus]
MDISPLPNRRSLLKGAAALSALAATSLAAPSALAAQRPSAVPLGVRRLTLPSGISTGDVSTNSAVLWSRASGPGRLHATLRAADEQGDRLTGRFARTVTLSGSQAHAGTDFTAKINARGLPAGTRFNMELYFEDESGRRSETGTGSFSTAPAPGKGRNRESAAQSFVWTADTAGQGYGINEEIGGMRGYAAMAATKPDFFLHSGDTIYADGPMSAEMTEPDGNIWRNMLTEEVSKVAETLNEYRGRHRYNMMDANLRAMYAQVPVIAQWDDHETVNNWYPGEIFEDPRYTVREVDTLAARGRRAWQEYMPIADVRALRPGTGFEAARIYRQVRRGPHLDVFALDMRSHKGPNTAGLETRQTALLGEEQLQWLIRSLRDSDATWKVIGNDLPLGLIVPDGKGQESISNAEHGAPLGRELELARLLSEIKKHDIKNVVFLTGDVHYCAAHHYSPERAAFSDFNGFWEFVAGPINAGSFGPNALDGTFGPRVDFQQAGPTMASPRSGEHQYFGHVEIPGDGSAFTVKLVNANGKVQYTKMLTRER